MTHPAPVLMAEQQAFLTTDPSLQPLRIAMCLPARVQALEAVLRVVALRGDGILRGDVDWELSSMVECLPCILETWAPAKGRKGEKEASRRQPGSSGELPSEGSKVVTIGWFLGELWAVEVTQSPGKAYRPT